MEYWLSPLKMLIFTWPVYVLIGYFLGRSHYKSKGKLKESFWVGVIGGAMVVVGSLVVFWALLALQAYYSWAIPRFWR